MNAQAYKLDQTDEGTFSYQDIFSYTLSDEAVEAAAGGPKNTCKGNSYCVTCASGYTIFIE